MSVSPSAWTSPDMTSIQRFIYTRIAELPQDGDAARFRRLVDLVDQHGVHPAPHPDCPRDTHPHCLSCRDTWPCLTIVMLSELWLDHPDHQRWRMLSGDLTGLEGYDDPDGTQA